MAPMTTEEQIELLKSFNPDFSQLKELINTPNIFRVLRLENVEIRHSNFLAWLLDCKENHGLKCAFLHPFLEGIIRDNVKGMENRLNDGSASLIDLEQLKLTGLNDFIVDREHYFIDSKGKKRYIDLLLVSTNSRFPLVICIENKVKSLQHDGQLKAYQDYVEGIAQYKNFRKMFLYLTPTNEMIENPLWLRITYKYVLEALEQIENHSTSAEVNMFIKNYTDVVRRDIMNADESLKKMCRDLFKQNKEVYRIIYKNTIGNEKAKLTGAITDILADLVESKKIEMIYSSNKKNNTEFKFVTKSLADIVPKETSKKSLRVWKSIYRIVYVINVANNEYGPDAINFYAVLVTGNDDEVIIETNESENMFTARITEICRSNATKFHVSNDIERTEKQKNSKDVTRIFNYHDNGVKSLKVPEEIDDEFIGILKAKIHGFIKSLTDDFESSIK